jgi:hypothetical protein
MSCLLFSPGFSPSPRRFASSSVENIFHHFHTPETILRAQCLPSLRVRAIAGCRNLHQPDAARCRYIAICPRRLLIIAAITSGSYGCAAAVMQIALMPSLMFIQATAAARARHARHMLDERAS